MEIFTDIRCKEAVSNPGFWPSLTPGERNSILELVPDFIERNEDGSIREEFWRYNNDWRAAVRQFQEDLSLGKYDPQWLADAAQAMEERARGEFDTWKNQEFEEFWGQKQKVAHTARAGAATNIKLGNLISQGLFRIGDIWTYARSFGRGEQAVVVEKDCELIEIRGKDLIFEIPGGTKKYRTRSGHVLSSGNASIENDLVIRSPTTHSILEKATLTNGSSPQTEAVLPVSKHEWSNGDTANLPELTPKSIERPSFLETVDQNELSLPSSPLSSARSDVSGPSAWAHKAIGLRQGLTKNERPEEVDDSTARNPDTIIYIMHNLGALETQILQIDGRVKNVPNGNAWKVFRLVRLNQDLGSLFDVRDKYCVESGV